MEREAATERLGSQPDLREIFPEGEPRESAMGCKIGAFAGVSERTEEKIAKNIAATMPAVRGHPAASTPHA